MATFCTDVCFMRFSHGSDSKESAEAEIALWFSAEEINNWKRTDLEAWVYE